MKNLDIFNLAALELFHLCLEKFPVQVRIDANQISNVLSGYYDLPESSVESFNQIVNIKEICQHTIYWLREEGFIRTSSETLDGTCYVNITQKGLSAMNRLPSSINENRTFRDIFYSGLSGVASGAASSVMADFLK